MTWVSHFNMVRNGKKSGLAGGCAATPCRAAHGFLLRSRERDDFGGEMNLPAV